jgi:lipoic acid synthetase
MVTKSGLMVGLGETEDELLEVFANMRAHNIDVLTVGQYLRPSKKHAEVVRYYKPEEFVALKAKALAMGFGHVEAGPLVRSSYHADEQIPAARRSLLAG